MTSRQEREAEVAKVTAATIKLISDAVGTALAERDAAHQARVHEALEHLRESFRVELARALGLPDGSTTGTSALLGMVQKHVRQLAQAREAIR